MLRAVTTLLLTLCFASAAFGAGDSPSLLVTLTRVILNPTAHRDRTAQDELQKRMLELAASEARDDAALAQAQREYFSASGRTLGRDLTALTILNAFLAQPSPSVAQGRFANHQLRQVMQRLRNANVTRVSGENLGLVIEGLRSTYAVAVPALPQGSDEEVKLWLHGQLEAVRLRAREMETAPVMVRDDLPSAPAPRNGAETTGYADTIGDLVRSDGAQNDIHALKGLASSYEVKSAAALATPMLGEPAADAAAVAEFLQAADDYFTMAGRVAGRDLALYELYEHALINLALSRMPTDLFNGESLERRARQLRNEAHTLEKLLEFPRQRFASLSGLPDTLAKMESFGQGFVETYGPLRTVSTSWLKARARAVAARPACVAPLAAEPAETAEAAAARRRNAN